MQKIYFLIYSVLESKVGRQSNLVKRNLTLTHSNTNNKSSDENPAKRFKTSLNNDFEDMFINDTSLSDKNTTNQLKSNFKYATNQQIQYENNVIVSNDFNNYNSYQVESIQQNCYTNVSIIYKKH